MTAQAMSQAFDKRRSLASARLFQNLGKLQEQLDEKIALLEAKQASA